MKTIFSLILSVSFFSSLAQLSGNLDTTFGVGGKVVLSLSGGEDKIYGMVIQPDQKLVVAGFASNSGTGKDFACARYDSFGTLDPSFGNGGIAMTDIQTNSEDIAYDITLQTDGKILLAGYTQTGSTKSAAMVRYNADGSLDANFGTNGIVVTEFVNGNQDEIKAIKTNAVNGTIVVGGSSRLSSGKSMPVIARYLSNGNPDNSFNGNGKQLMWLAPIDSFHVFTVEDIAVHADGKITGLGWANLFTGANEHWICRINANGSMDHSFSSDGAYYNWMGIETNDVAYSLLSDDAGNELYLGGTSDGYIYARNIHLDDPGLRDFYISNGFGNNSGDVNACYSLNKDNDGRFVMAGSLSDEWSGYKRFAVMRFNEDGTEDLTFGDNGRALTEFDDTVSECMASVIQADNKIVAAGYSGNDFALARYLGNTFLSAPQLLNPPDHTGLQNDYPIDFDWSNVAGASEYEFQWSNSSDFTGQSFTYSSSASSYYILINTVSQTMIYWRVRASDGTNWGPYSDTWLVIILEGEEEMSTSENSAYTDLEIFPNPASEMVYTNQSFTQATVYDAYGKEVFATNQPGSFIDIQTFKPGVYTIELQVGNRVLRKKLVKANRI